MNITSPSPSLKRGGCEIASYLAMTNNIRCFPLTTHYSLLYTRYPDFTSGLTTLYSLLTTYYNPTISTISFLVEHSKDHITKYKMITQNTKSG